MIPDIIALRRIAGVLILAALCIAGSPDAAAARDPAPDQPRVPAPLAAARHEATPSLEWVNPYICTGSGGGGGSDYGGTMPFVTTPFGMTNWSAQTRENRISVSSYAFEDDTIAGFIGTHQPAIWMGDYGYITLMPQVGELRTTPETRQLTFSHSDESAKPDYYAISLRAADGTRIRAELTATERCAFFRFRFPGAGVARVLIEMSRPGVPGFA